MILKLNPTEIVVGPRIGMFWPNKAAALGALMQRDGQTDPIKVRLVRGKSGKADVYHLVAGLHRLEGARQEAMGHIDAIEVFGGRDELLRIEASENMNRRDFGPIERSMFVRAMADIAEGEFAKGHDGLSAQQIGQVKRWHGNRDNVAIRADQRDELEAESSAAIVAGLYGWQSHVAASLGFSVRTLRDDLAIYRTIVAPFETELVRHLAERPLGQQRKSVMAIAAIPDEAARRALIETIASYPAMASVAEALHFIGIKTSAKAPPAEGQTKFLNNAGSNLDRLSASSWVSFAPTFAEKIKPSALLAVRDALDARIAELGGADGLAESGE